MVTATSRTFPRLGVGGEIFAGSEVAKIASSALSLKQHTALLGSAEPYFGALHHLMNHLAQSEIHGRGGAGFPLSRKIAAYEPYKGRVVVVANGSESEYLSHKDAALLLRHPHLVIDGLSILGSSLGARLGLIHVKSLDSEIAATLEAALGERDNFDSFPIELSAAAPEIGYSAGTETAVISSIEKMGGRPIYLPERPIVRGVKKRPTLISNVETFAQLALLARYGSEWYNSIGDSSEHGTRLLTIVTPSGRYEVVEVIAGTPFSEILRALNISRETLSCGLVGGYFGTIVDIQRLWSLRASAPSMKENGLSLGAGVLALSDRCPLVDAFEVIDYLGSQSSGQCGPCYMGLPELSALWSQIASGKARAGQLARITQVEDQVFRRGGCAMPDGAVSLSRSSVSQFRPEILVHESGRCSFPSNSGSFVPAGVHVGGS